MLPTLKTGCHFSLVFPSYFTNESEKCENKSKNPKSKNIREKNMKMAVGNVITQNDTFSLEDISSSSWWTLVVHCNGDLPIWWIQPLAHWSHNPICPISSRRTNCLNKVKACRANRLSLVDGRWSMQINGAKKEENRTTTHPLEITSVIWSGDTLKLGPEESVSGPHSKRSIS